MKAERLTAPRRFVVTVDYKWTGLQDIEVELTAEVFRWRFVGEARFREATWNHIPATLDAMLDAEAFRAGMGRRRHKGPRRASGGPRTGDPG